MPIKVLDAAIVGRIAAGEVVERPSSVAKELIENSIDAGATSITIEIRDGGAAYLRVTDNGCGIAPEQAAIAFENHATSKLVNAEQLSDIRTLGFRGEALPSIAAVSHVEMTSRQKGAASGVKLLIDGGYKKPVTEAGCPEGTTIIVRDLFFNVPVRRAFLKKAAYEASVVSELVSRMILGNPGVSFKFINNSKIVYHSFGDGNLKHAVFAVYGSTVAEHMIALDSSCGGMRITGMIGTGDLAKATRAQQAFYINGRTVRCPLLTQVLEQVCKSRVTIGTYPMCALTLTLPPSSVDVNVHPNKLEVRFRDEQSIRISAESILGKAFEGEKVLDFAKPLAKEFAKSIVVERKPTNVELIPTKVDNALTEVDNAPTEVDNAPTEVDNTLDKAESVPTKVEYNQTKVEIPVRRFNNFSMTLKEDSYVSQIVKPMIETAVEAEDKQDIPYRVIGTLFNTYILIETGEQLVIIDQHAAHERILYEKFMARMKNGMSASQALIVPVVINVSSREMEIIDENMKELSSAGYQIEPFGERTINVRAVPFIMGRSDIRMAFMDTLDSLSRIGAATMEIRSNEIATMACKAAVKAGDKLTDSEIQALIRQMGETEASPTCPHGRPVSRTMSRREIEKLFKRIQ